MVFERVEYHRIGEREESKSRRLARILASGGMSEVYVTPPIPHLTEEQRVEIEAREYDSMKVQIAVNWVQRHGIEGEIVAAVLRGAVNNLVEQANLQEAPSTQPTGL